MFLFGTMIFGSVSPVIDTNFVSGRTETVKAEIEFLSIMLHNSILIIWMDIFPSLHRVTFSIVIPSSTTTTSTAASTTASSTMMTLGMRTDLAKVIFTAVETYDSIRVAVRSCTTIETRLGS